MPRVKRNIQDGYNTAFATRLRKLIERDNITQNQLANIIGKTRQAVNNYTLGNTAPDADTIIKLANYFNVSSDYLLGLSNAISQNEDLKAVCKYTGLSERTINNLHEQVEALSCFHYDDFFDKDIYNEKYEEELKFFKKSLFVLNDLLGYLNFQDISQKIYDFVCVSKKIDYVYENYSHKMEGFADYPTGETSICVDESKQKELAGYEEKKEYLMFKILQDVQKAINKICLQNKCLIKDSGDNGND